MPAGDGTFVTLVQLAGEAKISGGFTATTNPTVTKAGEIIAEVEAVVVAKISQKYLLPLKAATDPTLSSYLVIRALVLALTVERVREITSVKSGQANVEQVAIKTSADLARKDVISIVAGDLPLPGEVLATSADGVRSFAVDCSKRPVFDRYREQW